MPKENQAQKEKWKSNRSNAIKKQATTVVNVVACLTNYTIGSQYTFSRLRSSGFPVS